MYEYDSSALAFFAALNLIDVLCARARVNMRSEDVKWNYCLESNKALGNAAFAPIINK